MYRVLHLLDSLGAGGIEMWLLRMAEAMPREEFAMDFFCKGATEGPYADKARQLGASVFHHRLKLDHVRFIRNLARTIQQGRYDIVHNHLDYAAAPGVWASRRMGIPVVSTIHSTRFLPTTWTRRPVVRQLRELYGRRSLAYTLKKSMIVTGVSRGVLDSIYPGHEHDERFRVLYLGVESSEKAKRAERDEFRRGLGLAPGTPVILQVGRLVQSKNHCGLLRIFKRIRNRIPNATLLLVGDGPQSTAINHMIAREGLGDAVQCLGCRNDVPRIMGCSDVFLFPSFHEGFPVVCLEAAGAELPVVGSDIPGLNEAVIHGRTGLLHPVDDEEAMANSVIRLLTDATLSEKTRQAAVKRIRGELSTEAVVRRLRQLYHDATQITPPQSIDRCAA